ncbi:hypothetical protein [Capillimicrobium parvum]|uniref:Uncharacterized protein n=1 Tax=Capillimicrobium parvum TaxID=2884022 RepID=A0A9E7BYW1_9ACTN|nr:hypothetical protein [Capillimicrobium parvum]UGS34605.1 hypothetical protein DSM104329_00984 [Capillimicrobium parvum]
MGPPLSDMEQLLRRARPEPSLAFTQDLEASLVDSRRARRRPSWRPSPRRAQRLVVAVGGVAAFAAAMLVLSIAGVRPLGTGGTNGAEAGQRCVSVTEWRVQREPVVTVTADGRLRLGGRPRLVPQQHLRCR